MSSFYGDAGDSESDERAYARAMHAVTHAADADDRVSARRTLARLARDGHAPSLAWVATRAWRRGDRPAAIVAAREGLAAGRSPDAHRTLGDWLWETSQALHGAAVSASASALRGGIDRHNDDEDEDDDENDTAAVPLGDMLQDLADAIGSDLDSDQVTPAAVAQAYVDEALACWSDGASAFDDVQCMLRLAQALASPSVGDLDSAREWWERAAALGDESAVFTLAHLALAEAAECEDMGVPTTKTKRPREDEPTAPDALEIDISQVHDSEIGLEQDDPQEHTSGPFKYVQKAAMRGDGACCRALGDISAGLWEPPNLDNNQPITNRETRERKQTKRTKRGARKSRDDAAAALDWYMVGIASGDEASLLRAAQVLYEGGRGVKRDAGRAVELLEQAARATQNPSMADVARLARMGDPDAGLKPDPVRAFEMYAESSRTESSAESMYALADMLWTGEGCKRDRRRAYALYRRAAADAAASTEVAEPSTTKSNTDVAHPDAAEDDDDEVRGSGSGGSRDQSGNVATAALLGMVRCLWLGEGARKSAVRARAAMRAALAATAASGASGFASDAVATNSTTSDGGVVSAATVAGLTDAEVDTMIESVLARLG